MSTEEGNRLIAEFMGAKEETGEIAASSIGKAKVSLDKMYFPKNERFPDNMYTCKAQDLEYNTSWDWLMPVVEKIETMGYEFSINGERLGEGLKHNTWIGLPNGNILEKDQWFSSKIESVYDAVIQFIQWYNQNKPNE